MLRIVFVAIVMVVSVTRAATAQDNVAFAQQRFARGVELYDGGDFKNAATEFEASLQLYQSPNSRLYLARSYAKLDRLGEAMTEYQRAERESAERAATDPRYAATHQAAVEEIAALQTRVAYVTVKVSPGPTTVVARVAGRPVPQPALGLPVPVTPGSVEVSVTAGGHVAFHSVVTTRPGEKASVYVTLVAAVSDTDRTASRLRIAGWVTLGVGTVSLAAGGLFGILAQRQYHDLVTSCGFAACAPGQPDAIATGRRWERLMNVSLIGGGIAALSGGVMLLLGHRAGATDGGGGGVSSVNWNGRVLMLTGRF